MELLAQLFDAETLGSESAFEPADADSSQAAALHRLELPWASRSSTTDVLTPAWSATDTLTPRKHLQPERVLAIPERSAEPSPASSPELDATLPDVEASLEPEPAKPMKLYAALEPFVFSVPEAALSEDALREVYTALSEYIRSVGEQLHLLPKGNRRARRVLLERRQSGIIQSVALQDFILVTEVLQDDAVAELVVAEGEAGLESANLLRMTKLAVQACPKPSVSSALAPVRYSHPSIGQLNASDQGRLLEDSSPKFRQVLLSTALNDLLILDAVDDDRAVSLMALIWALVEAGAELN